MQLNSDKNTTLFAHNVDYLGFKENWIVNTPREKTVLISLLDSDKQQHLPKGSTADQWFARIAMYVDDVNPPEVGAMTVKQAAELYEFLLMAYKNRCHVVVHCTAGLCRSGAVVEFLWRHFGYSEVTHVRLPNSHILNLLEDQGGFTRTKDDFEKIFNKLNSDW